jgi:hypothetical protein
MKRNLHHQQHIERELPELEKVRAKRSRSQPNSAVALTSLRKIATKFRTERARPFYPVRIIAKRFGLSPATVSRLYQQLSAERLLRSIWGSKTLLEPRELKHTEKPTLRGVALPVDLLRFTTAAEYRRTILAAQRELWNARVIAHLLFFERSAEEALHLLNRYHQRSVDAVLWISPESVSTETLLAPRELGIRIACVNTMDIHGVEECYTIPTGCTIRKVVRDKIGKG